MQCSQQIQFSLVRKIILKLMTSYKKCPNSLVGLQGLPPMTFIPPIFSAIFPTTNSTIFYTHIQCPSHIGFLSLSFPFSLPPSFFLTFVLFFAPTAPSIGIRSHVPLFLESVSSTGKGLLSARSALHSAY